MVIEILFGKQVESETFQTNLFYNKIKRSEEDLKRRIPNLQSFILKISKYRQSSTTYRQASSAHTLDENEQTITVNLKYRGEPTIDLLLKELDNQLTTLLEIYLDR